MPPKKVEFDWESPIHPYRSGLFSGGHPEIEIGIVCRKGSAIYKLYSGDCAICGEEVIVDDLDKWRDSGAILVCNECVRSKTGSTVELPMKSPTDDLAKALKSDRVAQELSAAVASSNSPWPAVYRAISVVLRNPSAGRREWEADFLAAAPVGSGELVDAWHPVLLGMSLDDEPEAIHALYNLCQIYPDFQAIREHLVALLVGGGNVDAFRVASEFSEQFPSNRVLAMFLDHARRLQ